MSASDKWTEDNTNCTKYIKINSLNEFENMVLPR